MWLMLYSPTPLQIHHTARKSLVLTSKVFDFANFSHGTLNFANMSRQILLPLPLAVELWVMQNLHQSWPAQSPWRNFGMNKNLFCVLYTININRAIGIARNVNVLFLLTIVGKRQGMEQRTKWNISWFNKHYSDSSSS